MLSFTEIKRGLTFSVLEGIFAQIYANITGGIFLPAFIILLHASDLTIGLLASVPFFSTISQIIGSFLIERYQNRKKIAITFSFISRSFWGLIIILILVLFDFRPNLLLTLLIILIIIHHIFGSISGVAWLSWMSNLVPAEIRGRFFGFRNSVLGIVTIFTTLLGGLFLDWYRISFSSSSQANSFLFLFTLAILSGFISLIILTKQPAVEESISKSLPLKKLVSGPFKNLAFKKMARFGLVWSFAVNFASPFFIVYMIRDLQFSYTLVSVITICSAIADLFGMGFWGHFSDKHGNRPVMIICVTAGSFLPFIWIFTGNSFLVFYLLIPLLHIAGGFFFAGYNLCSINLLFGLAPKKNNSMFFALWSMVNGVAAGLGAICGGLFASYFGSIVLNLPFGWISVFKLVFLLSAIMRFSSIFLLKRVTESQSIPTSGAIRILRSVRTWATTMGYHPLLQYFLPGKNLPRGSEDELWPFWK
jgi:MFS family permease